MSNNAKELSLFKEQMTKEEIEALSDEQILAMMIRERRTRLSQDQTNRMANVRRRRNVVIPTAKGGAS